MKIRHAQYGLWVMLVILGLLGSEALFSLDAKSHWGQMLTPEHLLQEVAWHLPLLHPDADQILSMMSQ